MKPTVNPTGAMIFILGIVMGIVVSHWFFALAAVPILVEFSYQARK